MADLQLTFTNNFGSLRMRQRDRVFDLLRKTAAEVETNARTLIQQSPAGGKTYQGHAASAPGEPPASDTGALANSFQTKVLSATDVEITVGAEHASLLEFGTSRMAARPFLQPAFEQAQPGFEAAMRQVIEA